MNVIPFFMMYFFVYLTLNFYDVDEYRIIFKTLSSLCFFVCSIFSYKKSPSTKKYSLTIITGLFFCLLGDILITLPTNYAFISGASFFAIGHIFFIIAFSSIYHIKFKDLILSIVCSFLFYLFITNNNSFYLDDKLTISCIYSFIISLMVIKSLYIFKLRKINSFFTYFTIIGAILFVLSDFVLSFEVFLIHAPNYLDAINLILYYTAQGLLAFSLSDTCLSSSKIGNHTGNTQCK